MECTTDTIESELIGLETMVARIRARQMDLLRIIDARQVATADGCRSLVEWTTGRLDIAPESASTLVRTARAFSDFPDIAAALADGEVTFDRGVELARLSATGAHDPISLGWRHDVSGLRREIAKRRRMAPTTEHQVCADRFFAMQPSFDERGWRLWGQLPGADGRLVERALSEKADSFPSLPNGARDTLGHRQADALVAIAHDSLDGTGPSTMSAPLVTVFVDAERASSTLGQSGATTDQGMQVGPNALEEALCSGSVQATITSSGQPLAAGRKTRIVSGPLRRAILHRDGGACAADGCQSRYRLQPHHIQPFSKGGRTDPENLTTLCWFHHHVVIHQMGYTIIRDGRPPGRVRFAPSNHGPP